MITITRKIIGNIIHNMSSTYVYREIKIPKLKISPRMDIFQIHKKIIKGTCTFILPKVDTSL